MVYCKNRLHAKGSYFQIPYQLFYNRSPHYAFFKVFDCLWFSYIRPFNKNKLKIHSIPCIFLGYASKDKGYLHIDVNFKNIYISHHITFHVAIFPFLSNDIIQALCVYVKSSSTLLLAHFFIDVSYYINLMRNHFYPLHLLFLHQFLLVLFIYHFLHLFSMSYLSLILKH